MILMEKTLAHGRYRVLLHVIEKRYYFYSSFFATYPRFFYIFSLSIEFDHFSLQLSWFIFIAKCREDEDR